MEYKIQNDYSPVHNRQEYIWYADFSAASSVYEYNDSAQESFFDSTSFDNFDRFGLIGNGFRSYFSKDGTFYVFGAAMTPRIIIDDKKIDLTTIAKSPITFKSAHVDATMGNGDLEAGRPHIDAYTFGYSIRVQDTKVHICCTIPSTDDGQRPFLSVEINPENKKTLHISFGDEESITFEASNGEPQVARYTI